MAVSLEVDLRYLDAGHVEHPTGTLEGLAVCTDQNEQIGCVDGVLIEPATRRVRYFVVDQVRRAHDPRKRCVLDAASPVVLDLSERTLRVGGVIDMEPLLDQVQPFSDEDVLTALFRGSAA